MTVDHFPCSLREYTFQFIGYVTVAEGFVFLSGFIAGFIFTKIAHDHDDAALWRYALRRARTIYLYHLGLFIILLLMIRIFATDDFMEVSWQFLQRQSPGVALIMIATMLYQPLLMEILPMYCVFMLLTPLVVKQITSNREILVLAASVVVWGAAQLGLQDYLVSITPIPFSIRLGAFDIFAWQLLFVGGVYFGSKGRTSFGKTSIARRRAVFLFASTIALLLFLCRHKLLVGDRIVKAVEPLVDHGAVGPLRLLNFGAVCLVIAWVYHLLKPSIVVRALARLGMHSLQIYSFHILLVFIACFFLAAITVGEAGKIIIALLGVSCLFLLALCLKKQPSPLRLRKSSQAQQ